MCKRDISSDVRININFIIVIIGGFFLCSLGTISLFTDFLWQCASSYDWTRDKRCQRENMAGMKTEREKPMLCIFPLYSGILIFAFLYFGTSFNEILLHLLRLGKLRCFFADSFLCDAVAMTPKCDIHRLAFEFLLHILCACVLLCTCTPSN